MCLYVDNQATQAFKNKHVGKEFVYLWKVLYRSTIKDGWVTPYQFTDANDGTVLTGTGKYTDSFCVEDEGVHCWVSYASAKCLLKRQEWSETEYKIVRVKCYMADLIAVGENDDIAFRKVKLLGQARMD